MTICSTSPAHTTLRDGLRLAGERARGRITSLREDLASERPSLIPIAVALVWSTLLLLPLRLFSHNRPHFEGLARLGPEWHWGLLTLCVALSQCLGYLFGDYWHRIIADVISAGCWAFIAVLLAQAAPHAGCWPVSIGPYVYCLFALAGVRSAVALTPYAVVDWLADARRRDLRLRAEAQAARAAKGGAADAGHE